ncbi:MAG: isoprenylcysteine carboxylmethyltransferase family protein [Actinobacteria bacterium]|nr:isoprenylcysteine carboxylmethyltransferase family protein [Actinomycetota bacterium]
MRASSPSGRGTGWVVGQTILMALVVASWFFGEGISRLGLALAAVGLAIALWSFSAMRGSLTPYPRPRRDGVLVDRGPYRYLRHPMYVGGALLFAGLSVVFSVWGIALTGALGVFWIGKARLEERHLLDRFPGYAEYRRRTLF